MSLARRCRDGIPLPSARDPGGCRVAPGLEPRDHRPVTTDGRRTYRVRRDWARLPKGMGFAKLSQLALDARGRVHAVQRGDPAALIFSADGEFAET